MRRTNALRLAVPVVLLLASGAGCRPTAKAPPAPPKTILLVTLDTTRADAVEPEGTTVPTPTLAGLAARGTRYSRAYTTVPMTLPAHASLFTGKLPPELGLHDNGRSLAEGTATLATHLSSAGWTTAAFVSGYPLSRRFGLDRGFGTYNDTLPERGVERRADTTTSAALAWLESAPQDRPLFVWVHYFDPHDPWEPPPQYRTLAPDSPYHGEVAFVDAELGRLLAAFERLRPQVTIAVVGDHGEGLGDWGETHHGNLVSEGTMRVPLLVAGPNIPATTVTTPVSARWLFGEILALAGIPTAEPSLSQPPPDLVTGEAMQPYLAWGWSPQVMVVAGDLKLVRTGKNALFDVVADPREEVDLAATTTIDRPLLAAARDYPLPSLAVVEPADQADRAALASLGYTSSSGTTHRDDRPEPRLMAHLLGDLEVAGALFARGAYGEAEPRLERILATDPDNPIATVQLAVVRSQGGDVATADRLFGRAASLAPDSIDVALYHGLHLLATGRLVEAQLLLERVVAAAPRRTAALSGLAAVRTAEGRLAEALSLRERAAAVDPNNPAAQAALGQAAMATGNTDLAIAAFEAARRSPGSAADSTTSHALELGVLYLAARRYAEAAAILDTVPTDHPGLAMALFKRAQVSVLLGEPDARERVARARASADGETRELIDREQLFDGLR